MKKGVSVVALIATVVVLATITATFVSSGGKTVKNLNETEFINEVIAVQNVLLEKGNNVENYLDKTMSIPFNNITLTEKEVDENGFKEKGELYRVDIEKLGLDNVKRGIGSTEEDFYFYSPVSKKIYYAKGYKNKYYTLTEDLLIQNKLDVYNALPVLKNLKFEKINDIEYIVKSKVKSENVFNYYVLTRKQNAKEIKFKNTVKVINEKETFNFDGYTYEFFVLEGTNFDFASDIVTFGISNKDEIEFTTHYTKNGNDVNAYIDLDFSNLKKQGETLKVTYKYQGEAEEERKIVVDNKINYDLNKAGKDIEFRIEYENGNIKLLKINGNDSRLKKLLEVK